MGLNALYATPIAHLAQAQQPIAFLAILGT